jgi:predicted outer membrane repeat protein
VVASSAVAVSGGSIDNNTAEVAGGGIYAVADSTIKLSNGTIQTNTASRSGGGVYLALGSTFEMTGGNIVNNIATTEYGGGVTLSANAAFSLNGGNIANNKAVYGGGVNIGEDSTFTMSKGAISANTASKQAGGVYVDEGCTFTRKGGSVSGNSAPEFSNIYPPEYEAKAQKENTPATDSGRSSGGGRVSGKYVTTNDSSYYESFEFVGDGVCFATYAMMIRMPMDYEIRGNRVVIKMEGQSAFVFDIKDRNTLVSIGGILLREGVVFTKR